MSFNKNCCLNGLNDKIMIALEFDQHTCSCMCLTLLSTNSRIICLVIVYIFLNERFNDFVWPSEGSSKRMIWLCLKYNFFPGKKKLTFSDATVNYLFQLKI